MKTLYIISLVLLFSLSGFSQIDTIPTQFYGVTENENYTYISSNTGLYILERDSNNVFGGIHNVQDSLGFLHIHKNYLISGRDHRLKIYDIIQPNDPLLSLDTLLSYEISEFEDFNSYFVIRLDLGNYVDKFYLANIVNDDLQIIFDSDSTNPPLSGFQRNSEFYYPYAFLCFGSWKDTLRVYRYNYIQNNFWRTLYNFIFQKYLTGAAAYFEILFTSDTYTDIMGDPVYNQKKYEIDTLNNIFNYLDSWDYFGTGADDINSFTILSLSQGALTERRYDFSPYQCNISFGYSSKFFNTDNNVFVGHTDTKLYYSSRVTNDSIIYKTIDFSLTNVQETTSKIRAYELFHNYPNPFNPTTKIEFQIEDLGFVDLKVYDVLGNEVATLVNEEKSAGIYEVEFNGSELTSGIYFYQLKAGNFVETKKMIVLK